MLALLRLVAFVLGFQLSGVGHFVVDAISVAIVGEAEHDEQCPVDRPCDDCPPGCPSCHCPNTLRSTVPAPTFAVAAELPLFEVAADPTNAVPVGPDLPSLYRPPRTHTVA